MYASRRFCPLRSPRGGHSARARLAPGCQQAVDDLAGRAPRRSRRIGGLVHQQVGVSMLQYARLVGQTDTHSHTTRVEVTLATGTYECVGSSTRRTYARGYKLATLRTLLTALVC